MNSQEIQNEAFKKFALAILRWGILYIGQWLIRRGVIDQPTIDSITTPDALLAALGALGIAATVVWQFWRSKVSAALPAAALRAPSDASLQDVKAKVKKNLKLIG